MRDKFCIFCITRTSNFPKNNIFLKLHCHTQQTYCLCGLGHIVPFRQQRKSFILAFPKAYIYSFFCCSHDVFSVSKVYHLCQYIYCLNKVDLFNCPLFKISSTIFISSKIPSIKSYSFASSYVTHAYSVLSLSSFTTPETYLQ